MTEHYIYAVLGVVLDLSIGFGQGPKKESSGALLVLAFLLSPFCRFSVLLFSFSLFRIFTWGPIICFIFFFYFAHNG